MEYSTFGRHVAMDAWGVDFDLLNDARLLEKYMKAAAEKLAPRCCHHRLRPSSRREPQFSCFCQRVIFPFTHTRKKGLPHWIVTPVVMKWIRWLRFAT